MADKLLATKLFLSLPVRAHSLVQQARCALPPPHCVHQIISFLCMLLQRSSLRLAGRPLSGT